MEKDYIKSHYAVRDKRVKWDLQFLLFDLTFLSLFADFCSVFCLFFISFFGMFSFCPFLRGSKSEEQRKKEKKNNLKWD